MTNFNEIASKFLGQQGSYSVDDTTFNPEYLVAMPRTIVREERDLENCVGGADVWHCREATFLLNNGVPVSGTLKIIYPQNTDLMIESKSFKLYLNSFDMCKMGDTVKESILNYEDQVKLDLSNILKTEEVEVRFFEENTEYKKYFPGEGYIRLEELINIESIETTSYKVDKTLLKVENSESEVSVVKVYTNILRSRCRHTKQKDTGSAYILIYFKNFKTINLESLLKYIISYRTEDEFHEFCSEQMYTDIRNLEGVQDLSIMLLYSRRGSLDINPIRYSNLSLRNMPLQWINSNTIKTEGQ